MGIDAGDVLGALCFPHMKRPVTHRSGARGGRVIVDDCRHVARLARRRGRLTPEEVVAVARAICDAFPPATR